MDQPYAMARAGSASLRRCAHALGAKQAATSNRLVKERSGTDFARGSFPAR